MGFAASGGNATGQLAAVRGLGPRRVSSWRRRHRRDPRGLAPPWGTGMRRGSRQTQRPASEPAGPTVAADDAPTSCLGDNGTASLPWALSTATCSAQVRRPASRPSFPAPSQPQRPTPRCRQICAGTPSSCSNFPGGPVHFRPFPLEKISPAPGNRIPPVFPGAVRRIDSLSPRTLRLEVGSNRPPQQYPVIGLWALNRVGGPIDSQAVGRAAGPRSMRSCRSRQASLPVSVGMDWGRRVPKRHPLDRVNQAPVPAAACSVLARRQSDRADSRR